MFQELKKQVQDNFDKLSKEQTLFYVTIDRDKVWEEYLEGFNDPIEKQGHNCNCCKSFLRQYSGVVAIINNEVVSIWDNIIVGEEFKTSVANLQKYIHSLPITDIFLVEFAGCGTDKNKDSKNNTTWNHFYFKAPSKFIYSKSMPVSIDTVLGTTRDNKAVLKRSLDELTLDASDTVLELVAQNSLYRGKEFEGLVKEFQKLQKEYKDVTNKDNFSWIKSTQITQTLSRIRNTAIGTLLTNLSEGMELDIAVGKFEQVVAPTNYKRPTALVTPKMVEQAKVKLQELGLENSLERRFANEADLNVNDILFTDKTSSATDVFSEMSKDVVVNPRTFSKIEQITIQDFIEKIVPTSKSIEILLENSHLPNLVSILTSKIEEAPSLFKWNNPFSWSYTGGIADSIKEKVKAAGGRVEGELRVSLSWSNHDDLDIHVIEPTNNRIYYASPRSNTSGHLDVDMNAGTGTSRTPVENIIWINKPSMVEGTYKVHVNQFCKRENNDQGFTVQIECNGEVFDFDFANNRDTDVVEFHYSKINGITIKGEVKSSVLSKEKWNVKTNQFHKVDKLMLSPNHWGTNVGNKHYFFLLENCVSDEQPRPFLNEFLKQEFDENRKVFEILGSKLKVDSTPHQLSGVGFSETKDSSVIVRVEGAFKRTLKVNF